MQKVLEARTKIIVQRPTRNIMLKLWRRLTRKDDVVYSPSLEAARLRHNIIDRIFYSTRYVYLLVPEGISRLGREDVTLSETLLPESKGGWHILTFSGKSPTGAAALAKILTRREGGYIHEVLYLQSHDNSGSARDNTGGVCCCPNCPCRCCSFNACKNTRK